MSSFQLVEAEVETNSSGKRRNSNKKKKNNRFHWYDNEYPAQLSLEDIEYYTHLTVQQIEGLFTPDYLCTDCYFRSMMDYEGWIPISFVCSIPAVALICENASFDGILSKLSTSSALEVSVQNETVRLKENWRQWLVPNGQGGFGVSELYKLDMGTAEGFIETSNESIVNEAIAGNEDELKVI